MEEPRATDMVANMVADALEWAMDQTPLSAFSDVETGAGPTFYVTMIDGRRFSLTVEQVES